MFLIAIKLDKPNCFYFIKSTLKLSVTSIINMIINTYVWDVALKLITKLLFFLLFHNGHPNFWVVELLAYLPNAPLGWRR